MPTIQIPNNWTPRPYQLSALQAFEQGKRRQSHIWHRRAGKDSFALQLGAIQAHMEIGTYWHLFPLQTQARKAIWHGIGADGKKFVEQSLPMEVRAATRQQEMQVELQCGSVWQMAGSDQYNSLVGSNVRGVIFSEWALCDPAAWDYIRPIIRENGGWALFITTYRGKNHAYRMHQRALKDPNWYAQTLTVDDTRRGDGAPVLTDDDIEAERTEGMAEPMIQQEYYCSPLAAFEGAYWGKAMLAMQNDSRITLIRYEPKLPVEASMDLGMDDSMTAIYTQQLGTEHRIIGADGWQGTPIPEVCRAFKEKPWPVSMVNLPHDAAVTGMNTGKTREQVFKDNGFTTRVIASPANTKSDDIEAGRNLLPNTWIDSELDVIIDAFSGYRTEPASEPGVFRLTPLHSWESHYADAWQCYAKSRKRGLGKDKPLDYTALDQRATVRM